MSRIVAIKISAVLMVKEECYSDPLNEVCDSLVSFADDASFAGIQILDVDELSINDTIGDMFSKKESDTDQAEQQ